jgi:hypothetical protein
MAGEAGRRALRALIAVAVTFAVFGAVSGASAADTTPPLPFTAPAVHLGVSSCSGSSCHGALQPWPGSTVRQDEFITWQEKDAHAKAYKVLMSERSKRIAKNLGLDNAYEAKICLDCHADNVPQEQRAKGFQIADGVGCESCHGGAVNWLGIHVSGKSDHGANVKAGLYPLEEPVARAKVCLSCHFGDGDRVITHRIMGAGHPRLAFELDTFTATQPAHFVVDADYLRRKATPDHVKVWAVGQVLAVDALAGAMIDPKRNQAGIFPELVFFDCYACHHPMSNVRWEPRDSAGIGPGVPRIADANMIMLGVFLDLFVPGQATEFHAKVKALHQASLKGYTATVAAAKELKTVTEALTSQVANVTVGPGQMRTLLTGVIDRGMRGEYVDYAAAEQATMAMSAIADAMRAGNALSAEQYKTMIAALNKCYAAVEKDEAYNPRTFLAALQAVEAAVPKG